MLRDVQRSATSPKMRIDRLPLRLALVAPEGRMSRAISAAVEENPEFLIDQEHGDVLVDFSAPAALAGSLERARTAGIPILVGTTGLDDLAGKRISDAAQHIPVLKAANTSLGVALLMRLVMKAANVLRDGWDIEILEAHHSLKADAPSGTALALGQAALDGRGKGGFELARSGTGLTRAAGSIGFASIRGGTVAGDHDVLFLGPDERLILGHRAENRMLFARGALAACQFLFRQQPGLYSMDDVIGQQ